MNRQQAPQPVVRPLTRLSSINEVAEFIKNYPADEDGNKEVVGSYEFENDSFTPISLNLTNTNSLNVYTIKCDEQHFVDSSGIENEIELSELPCYSTEHALNLYELMQNVAEAGGWDVGEFATENREVYDNYIIRFKLTLG